MEVDIKASQSNHVVDELIDNLAKNYQIDQVEDQGSENLSSVPKIEIENADNKNKGTVDIVDVSKNERAGMTFHDKSHDEVLIKDGNNEEVVNMTKNKVYVEKSSTVIQVVDNKYLIPYPSKNHETTPSPTSSESSDEFQQDEEFVDAEEAPVEIVPRRGERKMSISTLNVVLNANKTAGPNKTLPEVKHTIKDVSTSETGDGRVEIFNKEDNHMTEKEDQTRNKVVHESKAQIILQANQIKTSPGSLSAIKDNVVSKNVSNENNIQETLISNSNGENSSNQVTLNQTIVSKPPHTVETKGNFIGRVISSLPTFFIKSDNKTSTPATETEQKIVKPEDDANFDPSNKTEPVNGNVDVSKANEDTSNISVAAKIMDLQVNMGQSTSQSNEKHVITDVESNRIEKKEFNREHNLLTNNNSEEDRENDHLNFEETEASQLVGRSLEVTMNTTGKTTEPISAAGKQIMPEAENDKKSIEKTNIPNEKPVSEDSGTVPNTREVISKDGSDQSETPKTNTILDGLLTPAEELRPQNAEIDEGNKSMNIDSNKVTLMVSTDPNLNALNVNETLESNKTADIVVKDLSNETVIGSGIEDMGKQSVDLIPTTSRENKNESGTSYNTDNKAVVENISAEIGESLGKQQKVTVRSVQKTENITSVESASAKMDDTSQNQKDNIIAAIPDEVKKTINTQKGKVQHDNFEVANTEDSNSKKIVPVSGTLAPESSEIPPNVEGTKSVQKHRKSKRKLANALRRVR